MNSGLIPDWDTLRLVLEIHRKGGLSGAARALGVTHATISRRLAKAEDEAGLLFFERLPAGLRLTQAGQVILDHAETVETQTHSLDRALMAQQPGLSGVIRVTIPPLVLSEELARAFAEFSTTHPDIDLHFVGDNQLLNLHQREADVALRISARPPETLWGRKVTDQVAGYYASADWLRRHPLGHGDLGSDIPVIGFTAWPTPLPKLLQDKCPNARVALLSDDMIVALRFLREGLGITRVPRAIAEATPGLERITALPWEPYPPVWLLTHPELRAVPRIEALMAHLGAAMTRLRGAYTAP
ncbi:MAG: LysR family transcriptional regulator [Pseudomonadota bacterium]